MAFRYYYRDNDGTITELIERVQLGGTEMAGTDGLVMNAEQGSVGSSTITIDDPDGDFLVRGHRVFYVTETECAGDDYDGVVYSGYTTSQTYSRAREFIGAGRTIEVGLVDINTVFDRRIMNGAENNRPAETDVARIAWLLTTNEASLIDDDTYFSTDGPVDMDAADYRGQSFRNIVDDCSQQSGKNWFLWRSTGGYSIWYGPRGTTDFASDIKISNDPDDIDFSTVFAPSADWKLTRDPSRVYSGTYLNYAHGHVYVQRQTTAEDFARRDTTTYAPNVKTAAKAKYRANRVLSDIDTEEDVISVAIVVTRAQVNDVVAGQRIQVKATHLPDYVDYVWCRVLNRTVREITPTKVELALELSPDEPVGVAPASPVFGILSRAKGYNYLDKVWFDWVGDFPDTGGATQPTVGLIEALFDVGGPLAPTWIYYGWKMLGGGTIDVTFYTSTIGIANPWSATFAFLINGTIVHEETFVNDGNNSIDRRITALGIPVVADDVLTVSLHCDPPNVPFFQSPRGAGDNAEALTITGGSLS